MFSREITFNTDDIDIIQEVMDQLRGYVNVYAPKDQRIIDTLENAEDCLTFIESEGTERKGFFKLIDEDDND